MGNIFEGMNNYLEIELQKLVKRYGLTLNDLEYYMKINNLTVKEAYSLLNEVIGAIEKGQTPPPEIVSGLHIAGIYSKMAECLNSYNTKRGGIHGYSGFVFEDMHAAAEKVKGVNIEVLANNGKADFVVKDSLGNTAFGQAKTGYKPGQVKWDKYEGQNIIVDKGNTPLADDASKHGLPVQESSISKKQAEAVAKAQQFESKLTKKANAPITGTAVSAHAAGIQNCKIVAKAGIPIKLGATVYDVFTEQKSFKEASAELTKDSIKLVGTTYLSTAGITVANTVASSAVSAFAGTTIGASVTSAVTAGIAVGLGNIQFIKDGDRLSGKASASSDFEALDEEEAAAFDEELPDYLK